MRLCLQILDSQGLASGGPNNTNNDHTFVKLPVGSDRERTQRLVCKHCSSIGALVEAEWNEKRGKLLICVTFVLYQCILIVLTLTIVSIT